jgi:hypothetical protein
MAEANPTRRGRSHGGEKRRSLSKSAQLFLYDPAELQKEFDRNARQWEKETRYLSSVPDIVMHPSYQRILGMGRQALPLIFHELATKPNHWFWALNAIAGQDAARGETTFEGAVDAWLRWGKEYGYIT